jgi:hypothetical protein
LHGKIREKSIAESLGGVIVLALVHAKSNVQICSVVSKTACGQLVNSQVMSLAKCAPHYDDTHQTRAFCFKVKVMSC